MNVNWYLTGVVSIIGSIVLSVIANLFTDPIKNWLAERSLISKRKRVEQLKREFENVSSLSHDKYNLALYLSSLAFSSLLGLGISLIAFVFLSIIITGLDVSKPILEIISTAHSPGQEIARQIFCTILAIFASLYGAKFFYGCTTSVRLIQRIRRFNEYEKEVKLQLSRFDANVSKS